jgi:hypothetical protein
MAAGAVPLAASFTLLVGVYIAHALLWRRIMSDLQIARPTVRATLRVYFLASLGRYLPGKVWQLAGLAVLAGRAGMPAGSAAAARYSASSGSSPPACCSWESRCRSGPPRWTWTRR